VCLAPQELAKLIDSTVSAIVLTDASLVDRSIDEVVEALQAQPRWSDIPIILLCQTATSLPVSTKVLRSLLNVTLLERPTSARTLVSAVHAAIRSRSRQYEIRDQLIALSKADDALRTADQRKDEFLAMLAHELRNPLAPIRNASELLSRVLPAEPRLIATTGIIKRQITHLTRLVDDLLDVSRITQGRIELQRKPLELGPVIAQALESVEPLLREKRHSIAVHAGREPLHVNADNARLVQCVGNVLTNACKYTDAGGRIVIEVRRDSSQAVICVTDNGVGIPSEVLPQIFELFVQSKRTLDRAQGGLGIGLSVVRRLIEMHGGTVSASSAGPGLGSTFCLSLPLIESVRLESAPACMPEVPPKRILIVDDNTDAANSLASILELDGHEAQTAYSSTDALERAAGFDPDIVLLDIGLPGMDGYEVARQLRARGLKGQIVALTGYGRPEDIERALGAGFDAHLVKPVDLESLATALAM
jgi:signal transduction histidine kinase/CheY-like chemotaxis protein